MADIGKIFLSTEDMMAYAASSDVNQPVPQNQVQSPYDNYSMQRSKVINALNTPAPGAVKDWGNNFQGWGKPPEDISAWAAQHRADIQKAMAQQPVRLSGGTFTGSNGQTQAVPGAGATGMNFWKNTPVGQVVTPQQVMDYQNQPLTFTTSQDLVNPVNRNAMPDIIGPANYGKLLQSVLNQEQVNNQTNNAIKKTNATTKYKNDLTQPKGPTVKNLQDERAYFDNMISSLNTVKNLPRPLAGNPATGGMMTEETVTPQMITEWLNTPVETGNKDMMGKPTMRPLAETIPSDVKNLALGTVGQPLSKIDELIGQLTQQRDSIGQKLSGKFSGQQPTGQPTQQTSVPAGSINATEQTKQTFKKYKSMGYDFDTLKQAMKTKGVDIPEEARTVFDGV